MSDNDTVTIEVDGKSLQARKGQMLIEVTDAYDIYVPRFCYHHKLTVAANCRMCLVQVEKAPKPLPACATPVMEGMKVSTISAYAREAQKSVMEFLLINHPLDCPICDQGGECELQDLAMGYGSDVSRYQENKRVVKDKNIGPLVQTDLTRCIHCTRCVRFGEEIAGLRELGATGRGEFMEIGTYIEKSMVSELSGNVIDLCPVGALTSKPFRYSARTWEMTQHAGIAPHDSIGSNVHFHVKNGEVKRVVPAENEAVNEVWLSDRDRYSYEGLYTNDRLTCPMIKQDGNWQETDWETAIKLVVGKLQDVISSKGPSQIGTLVSPVATTEENYLLQKIIRSLGCNNIDHRVQHIDFQDQKNDPVFPLLGQSIIDLENLNAALLIGAYPRKQQPLLNHRLRKAALNGSDIMVVNQLDYDFNYRISERIISRSNEMTTCLAGILKALSADSKMEADAEDLLNDIQVNETHRAIAKKLSSANNATVLLGSIAESHPQFSEIRYLSQKIAALSNAKLGFLGQAANTTGAWLAGAVPHRGPGSKKNDQPGMDASLMLENMLACYVLFNIEPELDCWNGRLVLEALNTAETVIAFTPYQSEILKESADILLPISIYAENEGSYFNVEGRGQRFSACVPGQGEARPGWKVLRLLATKLDLLKRNEMSSSAEILRQLALELGLSEGESNSIDELYGDLENYISDGTFGAKQQFGKPNSITAPATSLSRIMDIPMYSVDALVRRASALQQTGDVADGVVHFNTSYAERLGLNGKDSVKVIQEDAQLELGYVIDDRIPNDTVMIHSGNPQTVALGGWFADVTVKKV